MRKRTALALALTFVCSSAGCGAEPDAAAPSQAPAAGGFKYSVENEDGSYREATPKEAAEMEQMALEAYQNLLDKRSAVDIAKAIDGFWRTREGAAAFNASPLAYRISEGKMLKDLGERAAADGIKAAAGFIIEEANAPYFRTVMTTYLAFDDKAAATAYFGRLSRDMAGVAGPSREFPISKKNHPPFTLRCIYVTETANSVNCHYMHSDKRVIGVLLYAEGPQLNFSGDKEAIDMLLGNDETLKRIGAVAAASFAYLDDAYY